MLVPIPPPAQDVYTGVGGWTDRQLPDGTIIWTSPTGHTYTTYPGSQAPVSAVCANRPPRCGPGERCPSRLSADLLAKSRLKRRHTRAHNKAKAVAAERRLNDDYAAELLAQRNKPPPF